VVFGDQSIDTRQGLRESGRTNAWIEDLRAEPFSAPRSEKLSHAIGDARRRDDLAEAAGVTFGSTCQRFWVAGAT